MDLHLVLDLNRPRAADEVDVLTLVDGAKLPQHPDRVAIGHDRCRSPMPWRNA
jgi:hypothetical protein